MSFTLLRIHLKPSSLPPAQRQPLTILPYEPTTRKFNARAPRLKGEHRWSSGDRGAPRHGHLNNTVSHARDRYPTQACDNDIGGGHFPTVALNLTMYTSRIRLRL
jgi:hypothetical protein